MFTVNPLPRIKSVLSQLQIEFNFLQKGKSKNTAEDFLAFQTVFTYSTVYKLTLSSLPVLCKVTNISVACLRKP